MSCSLRNNSCESRLFVRVQNNTDCSLFNAALESMRLETDGTLPWSKLKCVKTNLITANFSDEGVHPNSSGIQLLVENLWNNFSKKPSIHFHC